MVLSKAGSRHGFGEQHSDVCGEGMDIVGHKWAYPE